ncbi:MAG TPA: hypothetical protein VFB84_06675, partial [Micromonosporaceae bacterium]|nr:hypothetical protein [Micromonosporaceae bacterium]
DPSFQREADAPQDVPTRWPHPQRDNPRRDADAGLDGQASRVCRVWARRGGPDRPVASGTAAAITALPNIPNSMTSRR